MVDPNSDPNSVEAKDVANNAAPWTMSKNQTAVAEGITYHESENSFGFHLSADKNDKIDTAWRAPNGWYEGPDKWSVVAINFPKAFEPDDALTAHTVAQKAFPEAYRDFTGKMFAQPDENLGYVKMTNYYGGGIDHFETPVDHRIVVAPELNEKIDPAWRQPDGHYVSDEAKAGARASVVALSFPERFDPIELAAAHQDARDFFPDIYQRVIASTPSVGPDRPALEDEAALRSTTVAPAAEPPRVDVGPKDGWMNTNAQGERDRADRAGVTSDMEDAFAKGMTVAQVVKALDDELDFVEPTERSGFVNQVRATLGIPSRMTEEGKAEFNEWLEGYNVRKSLEAGASEPEAQATKGEPSIKDLMSAFDDAAPEAKAQVANDSMTQANPSERSDAVRPAASASSVQDTSPSISLEPSLPKAQPALKDLMLAFDETPSAVGSATTNPASATSENAADNRNRDSDGGAPRNLLETNGPQPNLPDDPFTDDRTSAAPSQPQVERLADANQSYSQNTPQKPEPNHPSQSQAPSPAQDQQGFMRPITAGEALVSAFASAFQRRPRSEPSPTGGASSGPGRDPPATPPTPIASKSPSSAQTASSSAPGQAETPQPNGGAPLASVSQAEPSPAADGVSGKPMRGSQALRNILTGFRPERSESISVPTTASQDPASPPQPGSARALFDRFNQSRMQPRRDSDLAQTAERAATAAVGAFAALEKADSAAILSRIREAAAASPGGIKEVLSEMRPGGAYEDLRKDFNATLARDEKFSASYEKAASALDAYAEHRNAAAPILPKANASVLARLEALDEQIVKASSELPGRDPGKSALDEALDKGREAVKNLVDSLRNALSREGPSASPGLSP